MESLFIPVYYTAVSTGLRQAELLEFRWRDVDLDDLVFSNPEGRPVDPSMLSHNFHRIAQKAGLENVRFHDLRHTWATLMFGKHVSPKVISDSLGHRTAAFTMDVYTAKIPTLAKEAINLLDEIMPPGLNGTNGGVNGVEK